MATEKMTTRLMITKMVLENFKSYAGRQEIGKTFDSRMKFEIILRFFRIHHVSLDIHCYQSFPSASINLLSHLEEVFLIPYIASS